MTETVGLFVAKAFVYGLMLASGFFLFNFFAKYVEFYGVHYLAGTLHTPHNDSPKRTPAHSWNEEWFCVRIPSLKINIENKNANPTHLPPRTVVPDSPPLAGA